MQTDLEKYCSLAVDLYKELHKIPELGGEEYKTSEFIENTLLGWGIKDIKHLFGTGISVTVGDESLPCIALRADIDGLPVKEETNLSYKSTHEGKMHACGHDGHMGALLAFSKFCYDNKDKLKCCVKFIFQPAEETDGGALGMINEGVLKNPDVKKVFGFHIWPSVPLGKAEYSLGASFAEAQRYEIHIKGNGGHGAIPEGVKNCLYTAAQIIEELKKIDEKYANSVISACALNSTGHHNVFADSAVIKGTIRTVVPSERENAVTNIKKACENSEKAYGCEVIPEFVYEYPCAVNHENELFELIDAAKSALGGENVYEGKCTFAAEDFAYFMQNSKGAHIKIGTGTSKNPSTLRPLHSPDYAIDENSIKNAVKIFYELIKKAH